jgi:hypothetical protein
MSESLALGWVHPGEVSGLFMQSVLGLLMADEQRGEHSRVLRNGGTIGVTSGPRIASARNEIVTHFLERTTAEWLLMIDSDMTFTPADVDLLFSVADPDERPVVGGLCFGGGRSGLMFPTLYRLVPGDENRDPIETIMDYPPDALCKVDATGAAFLLMHRSVLVKIGEHFGPPHPWFAEGTVYRTMAFGEDWAFCMRAKALDIPIYVHTGAKIGHVKPMLLDEDAYTAYRARREEIGDGGIAQAYQEKLTGRSRGGAVPTFAIVPQKGHTHLTEALVRQLARDAVDEVCVLDDGTDPDVLAMEDLGNAHLLEPKLTERNIHRLWNAGVRWAQEQANGPFNLAILNNDIRLGPHAMRRLATALRADDTLAAVCPSYGTPGSGVQYVRGTAGAGGLAGFCFMVRGELLGTSIPYFDEQFSWWYGDDDFVLNVQEAGLRCAIVHGASVEHLHGGSQTAGTATPDAAAADREHFAAKWGARVRFVEEEPCPV